jgi:copper homeostasis protein
MIIKEACVETKQEIDLAFEKKMDRIELCSHLEVGGLTPSVEMLEYAINKKLNVIAMIRVNDNFQASADEVLQMKKQINTFCSTKVKGFAFGILTADNKIDIKAIQELIKACGDKEKVFHMAFDSLTQDKLKSIDELAELGINRILTKGGQGKAIDNVDSLKAIYEYSKNKIEILAGGSVTNENYLEISAKTGIQLFHGRKLIF